MEPELAAALVAGVVEVGRIVADKAIEFGGAAPWAEQIGRRREAERTRRERDAQLIGLVQAALHEAGIVDQGGIIMDGWQRRLAKLVDGQHSWLRLAVARHALQYTQRDAPLPDELVSDLNWPPDEHEALKTLLLALRAGLATHSDWQALIAYYNQLATIEQQNVIRRALQDVGRLVVATQQGDAWRVQLVRQGLSAAEHTRLEERYREAIVDKYRMHSFRGIAQFRKALRLPLADIYVELGLNGWQERTSELEDVEESGEALARQRVEALNKRPREEDVLATEQRVVLLADPGAGKSMTLEYIALMLGVGEGQTRLGFDAPCLPLLLPLRDFAADARRNVSLQVYLLDYIATTFGFDANVKEFVRLALEHGHCAVLLDGLDEVGDTAEGGRLTRSQVVTRVQAFADSYCNKRRANRLIVTSRKEGYRDAMLADMRHVEISSLRPPEEIESFLLRFYSALEADGDPAITPAEAQTRAGSKVAGLLPQIMREDSVLLLATNPLLLTILVLIYENVGELPNRRVKLYNICAKTLIASWRQAQTERPSPLLQQLDEETVFNIMGRLAYWLHAHKPGGTAAIDLWESALVRALQAEEVTGDLKAIAQTFLHFCRFEAGLLSERGAGRFGFFHLTFEEYLAGYAIARTGDLPEQEQLLLPYWEDPRWREVILLAAGEVGIVMNSKALARMFLETLLALTPGDAAREGQAVVLAGRALRDIGTAAVPAATVARIERGLRETMQAWDADLNRPQSRPRITPQVRFQAGYVLDALGWLPPDLNSWVRCTGCAEGGGDLLVGKYPVTNAQFELFMLAGGYENPALWGGEASAAWQWRVKQHPNYRGDGPVTEPEYWRDERFGWPRRGFPVVGVSWYEAQAYCAWLTALLQQRAGGSGLSAARQALIADLGALGVERVQLPCDDEWVRIAGGAQGDRYPWDKVAATSADDVAAIVARATVHQSGIGQTSPVALYPQGASQPFGLIDLAGNVREWMRDGSGTRRWLRGGSWYGNPGSARVAARDDNLPDYSHYDVGFRVAAPVLGTGF